MQNREVTHLLTHDPEAPTNLSKILSNSTTRLTQEGDKPHVTVKEELSLLHQLTEFGLGRFLLANCGTNDFWTQYIVLHPKRGQKTGLNSEQKPFNTLEKWILEKAPVLRATQDRFKIFQEVIQSQLHSEMILASIPCGLMDDLLSLNYKGINEVKLVGIDLDPAALSAALQNTRTYGLEKIAQFIKANPWNLDIAERYHLVISNDLSIYETDDSKVVALYGEFNRALKSGGTLVTSFLTPPPSMSKTSPWDMTQINPEDLRIQRILFSDILRGKWQAFRDPFVTIRQLQEAEFRNIEIIYDRQRMFPTVVAQK